MKMDWRKKKEEYGEKSESLTIFKVEEKVFIAH